MRDRTRTIDWNNYPSTIGFQPGCFSSSGQFVFQDDFILARRKSRRRIFVSGRFQKKGDVYRGIFPIQPSSSSVLKCIGRNFSPYINVYRDTRRRDRYVFPMRNAFSDPEPTVGNRQRRIEILIVAARCPL